MGQVLRLVGSPDPVEVLDAEERRAALVLIYACAQQRRRGALARHRRQPCDPWAFLDPEEPDARVLASAWVRGWEDHEAVLTAVGRGACAAEAGQSPEACPYPADSDDEDESFLVKHWLYGWRARGGRCGGEPRIAPVIPLPRPAAQG
ncbi:ribosome modulation factor [Sporichthya polymorpha]|uniref:ribosome modulation factor n=1 Tax=Sporichthya polymorpha TaxID=35751 RepID=UPI00037B2312|nr:Rmf/CrpP family protein [Sporichthya polymorpha]